MDIGQKIRGIVNDAVSKAGQVVRQEVLTAIQHELPAKLGNHTNGAAVPQPEAPTRQQALRRAATTGRPGVKRSPRVIAKLQTNLAAHILANPGQRVEQIGEAFKLETKDLSLPIKKLLEEKVVRSEGTRRATKYFPANKKK